MMVTVYHPTFFAYKKHEAAFKTVTYILCTRKNTINLFELQFWLYIIECACGESSLKKSKNVPKSMRQ